MKIENTKQLIITAICFAVIAVLLLIFLPANRGDESSETAGITTDVGISTVASDAISTPESSELSKYLATKESISTSLNQVLSMLIEPSAGESKNEPTFIAEIEKRNGYEIISFEENDTGVVVSLQVYAPDLYTIAKKLDANTTYYSEDEALAALQQAIITADIISNKVTLEFAKTEDRYVPILTSEFLDALYGGAFRLYDELLKAGQ